MSAYRVELRPAAVRALRKIDPDMRRRLQGAISLLAADPRPPNSRKLRGRPGFRVRVGDYRILYAVEDDVLLIVVVSLGHRREVYERCASASSTIRPLHGRWFDTSSSAI